MTQDTFAIRRAAALTATLLLATLTLFLGAAGAARAGTYTVASCQDLGGAPLATVAWSTWFQYPDIDSVDTTCPRGGLHAQLKASTVHPPDAAAQVRFYSPADTLIVHYRLWRSARIKVGSPYYFNTEERYGSDWKWSGTGCTGNVNSCSGVGNPSVPLDKSNLWDRTPPTPVTGIALYISCGLDNSGTETCPATSGVSAETWLHRAEVTLADDVKPAFATAPTGALIDGTQTVSGTAAVSLLMTDKGGGLNAARVLVDGQVVANKVLGSSACRPPYTSRVPCPLQASTTIQVDTTQLADGHHTVQLVAQDVAGNTTTWGPADLVTANTPPDVSCDTTPTAPSSQLKLTAGLVVPRAKGRTAGQPAFSRTIRYATHRLAQMQGQLADANGTPVPNAPICVVARPDGSTDAPAPLARVTTDADGRFSVTVPRGSSRELWAIHRVVGGALAPRSVLHVIPRVTIRPSKRRLRNGEILTLRGSVSGGPIPKRGVLVRAEAWRGTRWQPFGETRARGSKGRYKLRYRFVGTTGVQRYTLRVHVVAQAGYPYAAGTSSRLHVRVRG